MTYPSLAVDADARVVPMQALRRWAAGGSRIAALVMLAAAAARPGAAPTGVDQAWSAVEALVATPRCRADSDCASIGVGSRPCGGPETYLAWSSQVTDADALRDAVARHAALRRIADEKAGVASTCSVAQQPAAQCRKADGQAWGVCMVMPPRSGPGGSATQR